MNFKGNEKYVLVFVQWHDGMIHTQWILFASYPRLQLVQDQIYLVRDHCIMTLDSNQNLIIKDFSRPFHYQIKFLKVHSVPIESDLNLTVPQDLERRKHTNL